MCAQWKAGVSHHWGFYKVIVASVWMVFMFPWEETDLCNEKRWLYGVFWHSVSLPVSSNFLFVLIYNCEFLSKSLTGETGWDWEMAL